MTIAASLLPFPALLLACSPIDRRVDRAPDGGGAVGGWQAVRERIASDGRGFVEQDGGLMVELPRVGLRLRAEADGLVVLGPQGERLRLRTRAWGREGAMQGVSATPPALGPCAEPLPGGPCVPRAERHAGGLTEWWVGLGAGLEQGFTVARAPAGEGPLVVEVALDGGEAPRAVGEGLALRDRVGASWTVGEVVARDGRGRVLPAAISPLADGLRIEVDDRGAVGPIEIDPVYTTAAWTAEGDAEYRRLGDRVAFVGDLDGDGYDEVVATYSYYRGSRSTTVGAWLYYGSASGPSSTPVELESDGLYYGDLTFRVARLGDVNGDGYDDMALGWASPLSTVGLVYVYLGSAAGVGSSPDLTIEAPESGAYFGAAIAGAGDVNGDGYADLAVGAFSYEGSSGLRGPGGAFIYHGSASGLSSGPATVLTGDTAYGYFGWALDGLGDVNGDGYDDLIVGAPEVDTYTGRASVYHGSPGGISTSPALVLTGGARFEFLGWAVAGAGDVDGDGYADALIPSFEERTVGLYLGSPTGLGAEPDHSFTDEGGSTVGAVVAGLGDLNGDGYADLAYARGDSTLVGNESVVIRLGSPDGFAEAPDLILEGDLASAAFAESLAGGGDANGDGYDDVLVGARNSSSYRGMVHLYAGYDADTPSSCVDPVTGIDGRVLRYVDADRDGFGSTTAELACPSSRAHADLATDCDDGDPAVNPAATEVCDGAGVDEDCDGLVDAEDPSVDASRHHPYYQDLDGDGFGGAAAGTACTAPAGFVASSTDCDDGDAGVNPAAVEVCDGAGVDEDCDGLVDDADPSLDRATTSVFYRDEDGDGYAGGMGAGFCSPPTGYFAALTDCDDGNRLVNPGAQEVCDDHDFDEDCDGLADDDDPSVDPTTRYQAFRDGDGDGYGGPTPVSACEPLEGYVRTSSDCRDDDPAFHPDAVEDDCTDPNDYNCDGVTLYTDEDGDGWAACADCDDRDAGRNPDQAEVPGDGIDQDCDGADASAPDGGDGGEDLKSGCRGCASASGAGGSGGAGIALLGLLAMARRRRGGPWRLSCDKEDML